MVIMIYICAYYRKINTIYTFYMYCSITCFWHCANYFCTNYFLNNISRNGISRFRCMCIYYYVPSKKVSVSILLISIKKSIFTFSNTKYQQMINSLSVLQALHFLVLICLSLIIHLEGCRMMSWYQTCADLLFHFQKVEHECCQHKNSAPWEAFAMHQALP